MSTRDINEIIKQNKREEKEAREKKRKKKKRDYFHQRDQKHCNYIKKERFF